MSYTKYRQKIHFRGPVVFGSNGDPQDISWYGDTSDAVVTYDASADEVFFNGCDLWLKDNDQLEFGDSSDIVIDWNSSDGDLKVIPAAANGEIQLGSTTYYMNFDADLGVVDVDLYGTAAAININRNMTSGVSNAAIMTIKQDHTSDDMPCLRLDQDASGAFALEANGWCDLGYEVAAAPSGTPDAGAARIIKAGSKFFIAVAADDSGTMKYLEISSSSTA